MALNPSKEADWKAMAKTLTMDEKSVSTVSLAIKDYKGLKDFQVGEAIYNAYLKGFAECKAKVFEAFSGLDLQGIKVDTGEEREEEGK